MLKADFGGILGITVCETRKRSTHLGQSRVLIGLGSLRTILWISPDNAEARFYSVPIVFDYLGKQFLACVIFEQ